MPGQMPDSSPLATATLPNPDWNWDFWFTVPLYPYQQRRSLLTEVVPDWIWTVEQLQGIFFVVTPIRMTIVRLEAGGLLVYAPVAPTPECIRLVNQLVAVHGEIKYIILPTVSGIEHKAFVGPFARRFPTAQIYVAPHQWSFPVNLPLSWLGLPKQRTHLLPADSRQTPFAEEFDYAILGPVDLRLGYFEEVAFFHRRSQTLLVTDTIIHIPVTPPTIIQLDPRPLLFHAKDKAADRPEDSFNNRLKGWQRIVLFTLYFRPGALKPIQWGKVFREAWQGGDRSAYWGLYPFDWQVDWQQSFNALCQIGNSNPLLVAPVLQLLILNRAPKETLNWAYQVATWQFQRVISCHFESPVTATPQQFLQAFAFVESGHKLSPLPTTQAMPEAEVKLLRGLDRLLCLIGVKPPV
jgi:hypothetical protein